MFMFVFVFYRRFGRFWASGGSGGSGASWGSGASGVSASCTGAPDAYGASGAEPTTIAGTELSRISYNYIMLHSFTLFYNV